MSSTVSRRLDETSDPLAQRRAGAARRKPAPRAELADEVKALLPDGLIDELFAGARTEEQIAGQRPREAAWALTRRSVTVLAGGPDLR